jgi:hypothetical protein
MTFSEAEVWTDRAQSPERFRLTHASFNPGNAMTVIFTQATARQLKALAKRLQQVIPPTLGTAPLPLHVAQAIAAQAIGHADFHAALVLADASAGTRPNRADEKDADFMAGPVDGVVRRLQVELIGRHPEDWPHMAHHMAFLGPVLRATHFLSPREGVSRSHLASQMTWAAYAALSGDARLPEELQQAVQHYLTGLGSAPEGARAAFENGREEWVDLLRGTAPRVASPVDRTNPNWIDGTAEVIVRRLGAAWERHHGQPLQGPNANRLALLAPVVEALHSLGAEPGLRRTELLTYLDLERCMALAYHGAVPASIRQALLSYLHTLEGFEPGHLIEGRPSVLPTSAMYHQHNAVAHTWYPILVEGTGEDLNLTTRERALRRAQERQFDSIPSLRDHYPHSPLLKGDAATILQGLVKELESGWDRSETLWGGRAIALLAAVLPALLSLGQAWRLPVTRAHLLRHLELGRVQALANVASQVAPDAKARLQDFLRAHAIGYIVDFQLGGGLKQSRAVHEQHDFLRSYWGKVLKPSTPERA